MTRNLGLNWLLKTVARTLPLTTLLFGCGDDVISKPTDAGRHDTGPDTGADDDASTGSKLGFRRQQLSDQFLADGVWEQPAQANDAWVAHPAQLADTNTGGAQMFATASTAATARAAFCHREAELRAEVFLYSVS